jgi:hypothetical protein
LLGLGGANHCKFGLFLSRNWHKIGWVLNEK